MIDPWRSGDVIVWRGVFRNRVWHAQPVIVIKDTPEEMCVTLLPGTECVAPEGYLDGKDSTKRRWSFKDKDWKLENYAWRTNRLLILLEPDTYYSTMYFWRADSNDFLLYYINFQLPFQRSHCGIDTLDMDLDLIINPDLDSTKRRWSFKDKDWKLENYAWRTNRLLILLELDTYYSTMYFWRADSNDFLLYYINFQLPFQRSHCGIDTLDMDLDLIINPDFSFRWKDEDDYQKAIDHEVIMPEWTQAIEIAKNEIFNKLEKRQYPYDGSWLNWMPDPNWLPPKLPENWDKI